MLRVFELNGKKIAFAQTKKMMF